MDSRIMLIDMDGPLADFESFFVEKWREKFPDEFFIPVEQRKEFFAYKDYPEHLRDKTVQIVTAPGFFRNLPATAGGIEAVKELVSRGHTIFICTADIYANKTGLADKRMWVEHHLGYDLAKTVIFTRDKTLIKGTYLIDDKPSITGICTPDWEHIIFDQPFNRNVSDKRRIAIDWSDWKEILL